MSEAILVALITGGLSLAGVIVTCLATAKKNETAMKVTQAVTDTKIEELTQLEQTLSGMWEGEAHDAFHGTYGQNEQKMLMFVNALENYFLTLNEIAVKYNNAEAKNIQTAQS